MLAPVWHPPFVVHLWSCFEVRVVRIMASARALFKLCLIDWHPNKRREVEQRTATCRVMIFFGSWIGSSSVPVVCQLCLCTYVKYVYPRSTLYVVESNFKLHALASLHLPMQSIIASYLRIRNKKCCRKQNIAALKHLFGFECRWGALSLSTFCLLKGWKVYRIVLYLRASIHEEEHPILLSKSWYLLCHSAVQKVVEGCRRRKQMLRTTWDSYVINKCWLDHSTDS